MNSSWLFAARACFATLAILLTTGLHGAGAAPRPATPRIIYFHETPPGPHPVGSAGGVVGLLLTSPTQPIVSPTIYLYGVRPSDRTICLHVERANATYETKIAVDVTGIGARSPLAIPFAGQTKRLGELSGRPAAEFAVLAHAAKSPDDCEGAGGDILPVSWAPAPSGRLVALILNPRASATADLLNGEGARDCNGLRSVANVPNQLTAFDTVCVVPNPRCSVESAHLRVRRAGDRGGTPPDIDATFRPGC